MANSEIRVTPFCTLTEYIVWSDENCANCQLYEDESTNINKAKCKAAFEIDLASVTDGTISMEAAKTIGCDLTGVRDACK